MLKDEKSLLECETAVAENRRRIALVMEQIHERIEPKIALSPSRRLETLASGLSGTPQFTAAQYAASPYPLLAECLAIGLYLGNLVSAQKHALSKTL